MTHMPSLTRAAAKSYRTADPYLSLPEKAIGRHHRYAGAGIEPSLTDLLADRLTHAVMARDSVSTDDLLAAVADARAKLRARRTA